MLERIAAQLLTKYLGEYVKGLEKENLQINVIGGDVVLERLELKTEALANLELPIEVKRGFLGSLTLSIPWKSLGSVPAVAKIHELFVVVGPKVSSGEDDATARDKRLQNTKLRRLQILELLRNKDDLDVDADEKKQQQAKTENDDGFMKRLITKIVDNIQIFIDKVHIRYEDEQEGLSFGITLEDLRAQSTDPDWRPAFLSGGQPNSHLVHKLVSLANFAIYWNGPGSRASKVQGFSSSCKTQNELEHFLSNLIHQTFSDPAVTNTEHEFILHPVSGDLKVVLNKQDLPDPSLSIPKLKLSFQFQRIALALEESQFRGFIQLFDHLEAYHRRYKYIHLRPKAKLLSGPDRAKYWWKYALSAVTITQKEKREAWSAARMSEFRRDRINYVALYRKKIALERGLVSASKQTKEKEAEIAKQLEVYEAKYEFDHLKLFRDLAYAAAKQDIKERREKRKAALEEQKLKQQATPQPTSFWGRWFGSSAPTAPSTTTTLENLDEELDKQLAILRLGKNSSLQLNMTKRKKNRWQTKRWLFHENGSKR
eukprot:TRINITY_DN4034_c0_g3_i1.p1 TRINITY_DN4034_c0_g3~~TRINITY_DN4034_c0_g3_i1.p1  ORF type:complete len:542 (-),score=132.61 TRINITY_DN4034_c0_g3_i1:760-2385(-)